MKRKTIKVIIYVISAGIIALIIDSKTEAEFMYGWLLGIWSMVIAHAIFYK